jgi:hypothetical protein
MRIEGAILGLSTKRLLSINRTRRCKMKLSQEKATEAAHRLMTIAEQIAQLERDGQGEWVKQLAIGAKLVRVGMTISVVQYSDGSRGAIRNSRLTCAS